MSVFYNDVFVFSSLESQRHYCAFLYTVSIRKGCFSKVSQLLFKGKRQKHTVCSWRAICSLWRAPLASVSPEGAAPVWWRWGSIDWLFWSASTRAEENNLLHNSFFKTVFVHLTTKRRNQQAAVDEGIHSFMIGENSVLLGSDWLKTSAGLK